MAFNCGIVGLPNVGKSTLFNALTQSSIEAANYPFCTIEPNVGIVPVNDNRLKQLAAIVNPEKVIATTVEFVDIAGLVAGASKGEGLGNQFLANIRQTDAIIHVVRCFADDNIVHVNGSIDPIADVETINTELMLADLKTLSQAIEKANKRIKTGDKNAQQQKELLETIEKQLDQGHLANLKNFSESQQGFLKTLSLLTVKPTLYVANISDDETKCRDYIETLANYAQENNCPMLTICANLEAEICQLDEADKQAFLDDIGQQQSGLDRLIMAGYQRLNLQTFFTAGVKEVRAWTIGVGDSAPTAAGAIHSDFERGFIRAETIAFDDFITYKGEKNAKENGKLRSEGKDYIVQDGDVIHFLFNT